MTVAKQVRGKRRQKKGRCLSSLWILLASSYHRRKSPPLFFTDRRIRGRERINVDDDKLGNENEMGKGGEREAGSRQRWEFLIFFSFLSWLINKPKSKNL